MTYLQKALAQQRAARLPEEDFTLADEGNAAALTVHASPSETWTFLWNGLVCAQFIETKKPARIVLTFPRHVIAIRGRNLDRVMASIGAMRLESVRVRLDSAQAGGESMSRTVLSEIVVSDRQTMPGLEPTA